MAASSSRLSARSAASSNSGGRNSGGGRTLSPAIDAASATVPSSLPVETLVEHLLAAKRSLSSMTAVLRANEIVTAARLTNEDVAIRAAQTEFLRRAIVDQVSLLIRARRSLQWTYDSRRRRFKSLIQTMDGANSHLQESMDMLRDTVIRDELGAVGNGVDGQRKNLMDFVDENSVHGMLEAMKKSLTDLQNVQQSFDGDLLRFDNDIRAVRRAATAPGDSDMPSSTSQRSMPGLLASLTDHSQHLAQLLSGLTRHFDLCVTAVRLADDDGAAALARFKEAESSSRVDPHDPANEVSVSGVLADQGSRLKPLSARDRADMIRVLVSDAAEVDDVVAEINERLAAMEREFGAIGDAAARIRAGNGNMLAASRMLGDIEARLAGYLAAEGEFVARWNIEQEAIGQRLAEMEDLYHFYESYASAYGSLVLEVERRRSVEDKALGIWRKAKESVDKLVETDRKQRELFRQEVGEFLPTDLWEGMRGGMRKWEVVPVDESTDERPSP